MEEKILGLSEHLEGEPERPESFSSKDSIPADSSAVLL